MKFTSVEEYLLSFPESVQVKLQQLRKVILDKAPRASEGISYNMPAYKLDGVLCYFAAFKNHIGFYAFPTSHAEFASELSKYKVGKGSVQFPLSEELPIELIQKMLEFRVRENQLKSAKN